MIDAIVEIVHTTKPRTLVYRAEMMASVALEIRSVDAVFTCDSNVPSPILEHIGPLAAAVETDAVSFWSDGYAYKFDGGDIPVLSPEVLLSRGDPLATRAVIGGRLDRAGLYETLIIPYTVHNEVRVEWGDPVRAVSPADDRNSLEALAVAAMSADPMPVVPPGAGADVFDGGREEYDATVYAACISGWAGWFSEASGLRLGAQFYGTETLFAGYLVEKIERFNVGGMVDPLIANAPMN